MEYYSVIKKNTFESVLMRWIKLEPIIQSEVSQKDKHLYRAFHLPLKSPLKSKHKDWQDDGVKDSTSKMEKHNKRIHSKTATKIKIKIFST